MWRWSDKDLRQVIDVLRELAPEEFTIRHIRIVSHYVASLSTDDSFGNIEQTCADKLISIGWLQTYQYRGHRYYSLHSIPRGGPKTWLSDRVEQERLATRLGLSKAWISKRLHTVE